MEEEEKNRGGGEEGHSLGHKLNIINIIHR